MIKIQGAVVQEQNVTFAIAIVKAHILSVRSDADNAMRSFRSLFPGMPIVLMAQDSWGTPTYYGRTDIVNFLKNVPLEAIPWKEYSFT